MRPNAESKMGTSEQSNRQFEPAVKLHGHLPRRKTGRSSCCRVYMQQYYQYAMGIRYRLVGHQDSDTIKIRIQQRENVYYVIMFAVL